MKTAFKILFLASLLTSMCHYAYAQCGAGTSYGSISPTSTWQNTASIGIGVMPYWSFNAVNGATYNFSNCSGTSEDTYLRIYNSTWAEQALNDDNGPYCATANASLDWTCTASGTYYVFLSHYTCSGLSSNQILSYKCVIPEWRVPNTGSNSYTYTCGSTQHIYDNGGSGGNYGDAWNGYTVITPSIGGNMMRVSGSITVEGGYDYLTIYDGSGTGGTILWGGSPHGSGTTCLTYAVPTITSTTGPLTVRFYSDGSTSCSGFDLTMSCYNPCTAGSISGAPASICVGSNVTYSWAGTGTFTCFQYQWNGTGGAWTDWGATNPYVWPASTPGSTLYVRAKIAGGACYSAAVSTLVQDNVAYAGIISPSYSGICTGSSVTLNSIDNSTALGNPTLYIRWYRWDGSAWTFITQNNSQTLTDTPPGVGNYTYLRRTWTSCGTECSPACYDATTMVVVGTASTAATSITATPNPACSGSTTTLTVNGGSLGTGASWTWGVGSCGPVFNETWGVLWPIYWKGATTTNYYYVDKVNITSTSADPMIGMESVGSFDPSIYKYIQIRYRVVSGTAGDAQIFYTNDRSPVAVGDQMVSGPLISDGQWHSLTIDMSAGAYWNGNGNIRGWRYDWCTASGVTMDLDNISLSAGQGSSMTMNISANTTYYVMAEGICNTTACVNVPVTTISSLPALPYAGEDQYICAATSITMAASGTGTWSVVSGPNTPNIVSPNATNTQIGTVTGLISGTYVFRWSVSNACGISYDDVVVIKQ